MTGTFFLQHLLFFCVGVFQDLLITYYYQVVARERAFSAAIASTAVTLVNLVVLVSILQNLETSALSLILAYAIGNGVGTFVVIRRHALRAYFRK